MRAIVATILLASLLLMPLPAPLARAAQDVALAVIVHASNPIDRLSHDELEALFTRSQTRWSDGMPVVPLNSAPGSQIRGTFDNAVLGLDAEGVGRFWLDRRIRGLGLPPTQVPDPSLAQRVVEKLRGAIAYVPEELVGPHVKVVARVRQRRIVAP